MGPKEIFQHLRQLIRPLWRRIAAALGVIGALQTIWPAIPEVLKAQLPILELPQLSWSVWSLIVVAVLLVGAVEGSLRIAAGLKVQINFANGRADALGALIEVNDPDLTIGDAFAEIAPADHNNDRAFEAIGNIIRDQLATGQLRAWGRKKNENFAGERWSPLQHVGQEYWAQADWTYAFLDRREDRQAHTYTTPAMPGVFGDVRFNRRQFERLWPANRQGGGFIELERRAPV